MTVLEKDDQGRILVNCSSVFDPTAAVIYIRSLFFAISYFRIQSVQKVHDQ